MTPTVIVGKGFTVTLSPGSITSNLKTGRVEDRDYDAAIDGIEALLLAMQEEGLDMTSPAVTMAVEVAVNACTNHL